MADVDFIERSFASAENKRTLFFKANVGCALDELRGDSIGDTSERSHAARDDNHGVGGIRAAGYIGSDIGIGLLLNFFGRRTDDLRDEIVASAESEFLGHDAQATVRGDEVDGLNASVGFEGQKKVFEK